MAAEVKKAMGAGKGKGKGETLLHVGLHFFGSATLNKAGKLDFGKIFKRIAVIFVRLL